MIICLIIYLCDHYFDHLLTQSMALYQSMALWTRLRRASQTGNGRNKNCAARFSGIASLGDHSFWKGVVSWYGAQILTHVDTLYLLLCDVVGIEASYKGPKGPGVVYLRFLTPWERGSQPCLEEIHLGCSGTSFQRRFHFGVWEVPLPDHLLEIHSSNTYLVRF